MARLKNIIPKKVAKKLLNRWRRRLHLQHWMIYFNYVPHCEIKGVHKAATVQVYEGHTDTRIEVRWTDNFDDLRHSIVHELIHLWHCAPGLDRRKFDDATQAMLTEQEEHAVSMTTGWILTHGKYDDDDLRPKPKEARP